MQELRVLTNILHIIHSIQGYENSGRIIVLLPFIVKCDHLYYGYF